jgi:acyl-CoA reductase-like NAD-dependent aldehyde dehydrogenase
VNVEKFFIGGRWVAPENGAALDVIDPATEEVIGTAAVPSTKDAVRAIEAARAAFDDGPWPRMPVAERAAAVRRIGELLMRRKDEIVDLMIREVGSTQILAKTFQGVWPIGFYAKCAQWAEEFPWEEPAAAQDAPLPSSALLVREPVGVVSSITPFNYPFFVNSGKVAPSIVMGNTLVLKTSPWTPLDAFVIAQAAEEAGIPPGVLNVIGGGGADVGEEMVSNPMVDMVSFTGSVVVGRAVAALAAKTIKKVQLELGGKSAIVVLDDADPEQVVPGAFGGCMIHAGQGCGCTTRLLVPEKMHDDLVERLVAMCRSAKVGDPREADTVVGPLIRDQHRQRVESYVQAGIDEGAAIATGGRRPPHLDKGFFYEPTIFTGVRNDMKIAQEEIFGPVLCVIPYRDEDEAVRIANDSMFGLGGAVMSANRDRAMAIAKRMRTGYVGLGTVPPNFNAAWGGYKQSGVGREWRMGLEEYTELKNITWLG